MLHAVANFFMKSKLSRLRMAVMSE